MPALRADLSFLGTWVADRAEALSSFFVDAARAREDRRFLLGGALYPPSYPWPANVTRVGHLPTRDLPAFFCSSRLSLHLTRRAAAALGYCPSAGLFEAAACGAAIVSDAFEGLDRFFTEGREIIVARSAADVTREVVAAIGSGGNYAQSAALALAENTDFDAEDIARKAMKIAAEICIYTNESVTLEKIEA